MKRAERRALIAVAAVSLLAAACAKRQVATVMPPPPEPSPAAAPAPPPAPVPLPPPPPAPTPAAPPAPAPPAPAYPPPATRARIDQLLANIEDAYFDYDRATLRPDALKALQSDATELRDILKSYPAFKLTVEGHCDERGSAEYNVALGAQRASAAKDFLVQAGIPPAQLDVTSYGNERPVCTEHSEACWQRNRRVHFVAMAPPNQ
jgi:peptidoglycan-associated lipoprotein